MIPDSKIFLGVPTRGAIYWAVAQALLQIQERHPQAIFHIEPGASSSSDTRNKIVKRFLQETDCEVMFQLDDDVYPRLDMLDLAQSTYDITGATYLLMYTTAQMPVPCAFTFNPTTGKYAPIKDPFTQQGRVACDAVATGCIAIKRRVLEHPDMRAPFAMSFDEWGIQSRGDDISFCHRAREAGFSIAADFDYHADHLPAHTSLNMIHSRYQDVFARALEAESKKPQVVLAR